MSSRRSIGRLSGMLAIGSLLVATSLVSAETARADDAPGGAYGSTARVGSGAVTASPAIAAADPQHIIHCDHTYSFSDANGKFTLARACGYARGNWGYYISSKWCIQMTSSVAERGMDWYLNGVLKARQAPHPFEPCDYVFHGAFNPVQGNDAVLYGDVYTGYLSGGVKWELFIHGSLKFVNSPCSPTSC